MDLFQVFEREGGKFDGLNRAGVSRSFDDSKTKARERSSSPHLDRSSIKRTVGQLQHADVLSADVFETVAEREFAEAEVYAATGSTSESNGGKIRLAHQIRHEVAVPKSYHYIPISQHKACLDPARTYPFTLDPFQQVAISCIERNESVLVSAHTSAGKTVVAEYAIAQALRNKERVIYTSPIKALSNQKYRELDQEFGDVGLMTGDITINPSASCLVMTTEILRSMMYRGSEIMREVAWVVFDEIHYMRDKERGVVWEEAIILLPHKVRYVFLSATIPNAKQFAEWICKIHSQPCHVVYTNYRPVPLQHYLFAANGDGIHLCVDEKGNFRNDNFIKATSSLSDQSSINAQSGRKGGKKNLKGQSDLFKIIKMIWSRNYQPVIVFSFSKRDCESNAIQMSKLDFNSAEEKDIVLNVFKNAIVSLSEDDQRLPQIQHLQPLLTRGIGIHHSGLLPILKEVIEILFQEGLVKVLFATETFSIGLNMPAKTVVFTNMRKWDGVDFRWISGGEYIQMSGRAGRRGLDDRGIVILMLDEKIEPLAAQNILKGEADYLNSAFHLTYNMILNLLRVDGCNPEYMLEHSFYQFQKSEQAPLLEKSILLLEKEITDMTFKDENLMAEYHGIIEQASIYKRQIRSVINSPSNCLPFLQPGRLVKVTHNGFTWGVIVSCRSVDRDHHCVEVLIEKNGDVTQPDDSISGVSIIQIPLSAFEELSSIRLFLPKNITQMDTQIQVGKTLREALRRFPHGVPKLDPIEDMHISDDDFHSLIEKVDSLERELCQVRFAPLSDALRVEYIQYKEKRSKMIELKRLKGQLKEAKAILQLDELKHRKRLLRRLGYTSDTDVIETKGRVACEISSGDELILTELMFNGTFSDLSPAQIMALLSCFVFDERSKEASPVRENMKSVLNILKETARQIAKASFDCKIVLDEEEYIEKFRADLVEVVCAWCEGAKFSQICKMTDIFEGSIIRAMRRLEELARQMAAASRQIGNEQLEAKFNEGISYIKRDIVFAASLYL